MLQNQFYDDTEFQVAKIHYLSSNNTIVVQYPNSLSIISISTLQIMFKVPLTSYVPSTPNTNLMVFDEISHFGYYVKNLTNTTSAL